jgi:alkylhydroperoxidase/carboxymuconolactone decarboxylase family protein YurZ
MTPYRPFNDSNMRCTDAMMMAHRELSAFFNAVTELHGLEQAKLSASEWLHEFVEVDCLPASTREWRSITVKASARLAQRVSASSLSVTHA